MTTTDPPLSPIAPVLPVPTSVPVEDIPEYLRLRKEVEELTAVLNEKKEAMKALEKNVQVFMKSTGVSNIQLSDHKAIAMKVTQVKIPVTKTSIKDRIFSFPEISREVAQRLYDYIYNYNRGYKTKEKIDISQTTPTQ